MNTFSGGRGQETCKPSKERMPLGRGEKRGGAAPPPPTSNSLHLRSGGAQTYRVTAGLIPHPFGAAPPNSHSKRVGQGQLLGHLPFAANFAPDLGPLRIVFSPLWQTGKPACGRSGISPPARHRHAHVLARYRAFTKETHHAQG